MRIQKPLVLVAVLGLFATACEEAPTPPFGEEGSEQATTSATDIFTPNPSPEEVGPMPSVELPEVENTPGPQLSTATDGTTEGSMTPSELDATLKPGETITETKTIELPDVPPAGDVLFAFDLTGSMGGELSTLKTKSVDIMNAVDGVIGDVRFGLISHEDYPYSFDSSTEPGCTYSSQYGSPSAGDQAYRRDQVLTSTNSDVASAITDMTLKFGYDGPESYSRALYESVAELTSDGADPDFGPLGWRPDAKKIVVAFNDNVPHDCAVDAIIGGSRDTGIDPGRDDEVGTSDDLEILSVLQTMADNDVTLINIHSGFFSDTDPLWQAYAEETGGTNFSINSDGTFPAGTNPASEIARLIEEEVSTLDELTLKVCPADQEEFGDWRVSAGTATGVTLPSTETLDVTLSPPEGTEDGEYNFQVCAIGDGTVFARQDVQITVQTSIPVAIDSRAATRTR